MNILKKHYHRHQESAPLLLVENLDVLYDSGPALSAISFQLKRGEQVAIVGPNGAGKSTIIKVIAGLIKPTDGKVTIFGTEPSGHICIAYIPQRNVVDWNFPADVFDVVMMGRISKIGLFRQPANKDKKIVIDALETVGMSHMSKRQISQLSGGQQQRVFIARALAQESELMLLDEPLTGLDSNSQSGIFSLLENLKKRNVTILMSLHDLKLTRDKFEHVMLLNRHLIGFGRPDQVFSPQNLTRAYGSHLHLVPEENGLLALGDTCCHEGDELND